DKELLRAARAHGINLPKGRGLKIYKTPQAVRDALNEMVSAGLPINPAALKLAGKSTLRKAAQYFGIKLPDAQYEKLYKNKTDVEDALRRREEAGLKNTPVALNKLKEEDGDSTLYNAAMAFGVDLPRVFEFKHYYSKEQVEIELARRTGEGYLNTPVALRALRSMGGDRILLSAAKHFGVILPPSRPKKEKVNQVKLGPMTSAEVSHRAAVMRYESLPEEDAVRLWALSQDGDFESRTTLVEHMARFVMDYIEQRFAVDLSVPNERSSHMLSIAYLAMLDAIDKWDYEDEGPGFYQFLKSKIDQALSPKRRSKKTDEADDLETRLAGGMRSLDAGHPWGAVSLQEQLKTGHGDTMNKTMAELVSRPDAARADSRVQSRESMLTSPALLQQAVEERDKASFGEQLFTSDDKDRLVDELRALMNSKNIRTELRKIGIKKFSLYLVGSMGYLGTALKGESDANLIIVSDASPEVLEGALFIFERVIGGRLSYNAPTSLPVLTIGKHGSYYQSIAEGNGFISLLREHNVGSPDSGFASLEAVSLSRDNLRHIFDDYGEYGPGDLDTLSRAENMSQRADRRALMRL
ncbi:MAG TPA: hypothetical protein PLV52_05895, partial [Candidatus Omnitrophota bacterium]|nr:hypothetical protein [Candidatus Omnitrophota bacterium]